MRGMTVEALSSYLARIVEENPERAKLPVGVLLEKMGAVNNMAEVCLYSYGGSEVGVSFIPSDILTFYHPSHMFEDPTEIPKDNS